LGPIFSLVLGARYRLPARLIELRLASALGNPVNERSIEYPWAIEHLRAQKGRKILDVGCSESALLTSYLLSKGYDAYGLDIVDCRSLPLGRFFLRDARNTSLPDSSFDVVILLSVLEHIGNDANEDDIKTMHELGRILRKGGVILFTSPFAVEYSNRGQRFFDSERLSRLTQSFNVIERSYFVQRGVRWVEATLNEAKAATFGYAGVNSIAISVMVLEKT